MKVRKQMRSKIYFILSMIIFGTIGIFVRNIGMSSSMVAFLRGIIGSLLLGSILIFKRQSISWETLKKNILVLIISSLALGCNWIFLFQAIKYTTIANATLSYYFAPVFVVILSPLILKEKLSLKKVLCVGIALIGMFLIIQNNDRFDVKYNHFQGIVYGTMAAGFYAVLMLSNKFIKNMHGLETTLIQLGLSAVILLPYNIFTESINLSQVSKLSVINLIVLGVLHTGVGFFLFFSGMKNLKGQSIAALSYIDPATSLLVSFFLFKEEMTVIKIIGAVLLLGSTFISENKGRENKK